MKQHPERRKTLLFCQACDYRAAPTGEWLVHEKTDCSVYECPRCGATVTIRARLEH